MEGVQIIDQNLKFEGLGKRLGKSERGSCSGARKCALAATAYALANGAPVSLFRALTPTVKELLLWSWRCLWRE